MVPPIAFLLSVAGLGVSLTGFAGLVSAFRRGSAWERMDSYRLRQIPEMGLAATLVGLGTFALEDTTGNSATTIRIAAVASLLFLLWHAFVLTRRIGSIALHQSWRRWVSVIFIDVLVLGLAALCLFAPSAPGFEWLLIAMLARPMLAFVLVLVDVAEN